MKKKGIQEIAKLANTSIGTVDRALHGRKGVSKATRDRIVRIAATMGYVPNLAARSLSRGRPNFRIGVCIPQDPHFFYDELRDGIMDEARRFESLGVDVVYRPVQRFGVGETERVREMLNTEIHALVITPGDPQPLKPLIDEAEQKGIRVVCVVSDAPESSRSTIICADPGLVGGLAAELMARFVGPRGQVAVATGMLYAENHRKKTESFCKDLPLYCEGGEVVDVIEGHDDHDETFQKCLDLLGRYPDLSGIYVNTAFCLPVCYALRARGVAGKIQLVTADLFEEMVPFFEKSVIQASIHQRPYRQGQVTTQMLVEHFLHNKPLPPMLCLNPTVVLRSNLFAFRETRKLAAT